MSEIILELIADRVKYHSSEATNYGSKNSSYHQKELDWWKGWLKCLQEGGYCKK